MADNEEAVVHACTSLVFCVLDLNQFQKQLLGQVMWTCPPQSTLWRRPEHVSCVSRVLRLSRRACLAVLSDKRGTSRQVTSRHVTTFPYAKMHGLDSVSRRDVTSQVKHGLNDLRVGK